MKKAKRIFILHFFMYNKKVSIFTREGMKKYEK